MKFADPVFFLLYIPLLALLFWQWRREKPALLFPLSNLAPRSIWHQIFRLPILLQALGVGFLIFGLARPQDSTDHVSSDTEGIDIVICLDISDSMLIEDMIPINRLESAKETIRRFVENRPNDRLGIVIFAGEAFTLIPPTLDHKLVLSRIETIRTAQEANIKDGTALGVALAAGAQRLRESESKSRVMVFLTDGENNSGTIDPDTGLEVAKGYGLRIYSIGIGKDGPTKLPIVGRDMFGNRVKTYQPFESTVNEELLSRMAKETGGKYYRASREDSLKDVFADIDKLEKNRIEAQKFVLYEELYRQYVVFGLGLLILALVLKQVVLRSFP